MGTALSALRSLYHFLTRLNTTYNALLARLQTSPGLPHPNPTTSYWQLPNHSLSNVQSSSLPTEADIVILGSGITGCAIAKSLLEGYSHAHKGGKTPRIVLLEARGLCSGATGRNGGNIKETSYADWRHLKKLKGKERAREITAFRASHLELLVRMAEEEGVAEVCGMQRVRTVDYFFDEPAFEAARERLEEYLTDLGERRKEEVQRRGWRLWTASEARQEFGLDTLVGAISYDAGSLSPYLLICSLFQKLLDKYPNFSIETFTPCTSITSSGTSSLLLETPRGTLQSPTILHATNAHTSHLLPGLLTKLFPVRGTMTAQLLSTPTPPPISPQTMSLSFVWKRGFEYLTFRSRPKPSSASTPGEEETVYMLGGGLVQALDEGLAEFGVSDDSSIDLAVRAHDLGILPAIFGGSSETLAAWSGIMCWSSDLLPWVGRVGREVTGRGGGEEYVAAGYSGEGMVNAWGCGSEVARQVLRRDGIEVEESVLPEGMRYSAKRLKTADVRKLTELF